MIGYRLVQGAATSLVASAGAGARFDNLTTDVTIGLPPEVAPETHRNTPILDFGARFRQRAGPVLFRIRLSYDPSLEDLSNFELLDAYDVVIDLIKGLTFKWSLLHEFNNPPPSGDEKNDLTMTFQLGWALGVK